LRRAAWLVFFVAACGGAKVRPAAEDFDTVTAALLDAHWSFRPQSAIDNGLHEYDGQVPDHSASGIAAEVVRLKAARARLSQFDRAALTAEQRLEHAVFLAEIDLQLFKLEEERAPFTSPLFWVMTTRGLEVANYLDRDYAPLAQRAAAVIRASEGAERYVGYAKALLEPALPRAHLGTALMMLRGNVEHLRGESKRQVAGLPPAERAKAEAALERIAAADEDFAKFLEGRMATATDGFALGEARLLGLLAATEGVKVDFATLERVARAELDRDVAALAAAAKEIDPKRPAADVIREVMADKPAPDQVIGVATEQVKLTREFMVQKDLVSIPSDDPIEVRPSPPYLAFNPAFLYGPGPFEKEKLPAFYYVTLPNPTWPEAKRRDHVRPRNMLLFTSAHEVWPGHFLQGLHQRKNPSRVLRSFCSYAFAEGWGVYVEEMMWEEGLGDRSPRVHIGQLLSSVVRASRFVAALGLHARGMSVDEATALFAPFLDAENARQQAVRGTFDPQYYSYTLGKVMMRKLRDDLRAKEGAAFTLKSFHDRLLGTGCPPLPVVRDALLGADAAGSPL
jgi:uncharacterized protein (DUF885 family)